MCIMMRLLLPVILIPALFLFAGCASTPQKRIAANPDLFAAFPTEIQEMVRHGQIDLGFNQDMVRLALGDPQEVSTRRSADGTQVFWVYYGVRFTQEFVQPDFGLAFNRYYFYRPFPRTVTRRESFVRSRIEFIDGIVTTVEQLEE
jgi:hypothetical protein